MTNSFLAALQSQAQKTQQEREKTQAREQFARDMGNAWTQPTPEAKAGAQATALLSAFAAMPTPGPVLPEPIHIPEVRIERVLDRGRIDVYFSDKPDDRTLEILRGNGFRFRPSDKAWFHADNGRNRCILEDLLGVEFENPFVKECGVHDSTAGVPVDKGEDADMRDVVPASPEFERYRQQVDELIEHLNIRPADLMLLAIDALHKTTFGRN
jgi:hypothetical protein